jgi:hypothetical protein
MMTMISTNPMTIDAAITIIRRKPQSERGWITREALQTLRAAGYNNAAIEREARRELTSADLEALIEA